MLQYFQSISFLHRHQEVFHLPLWSIILLYVHRSAQSTAHSHPVFTFLPFPSGQTTSSAVAVYQCQTDTIIFGSANVRYLRSDTADNQY